MPELRRRCRECDEVRTVPGLSATCPACGADYGRYVIGLDQPAESGLPAQEPKQERGQTAAFVTDELSRPPGRVR